MANSTATVDLFGGTGDGNLVARPGKTVPGSQAIAVALVDVWHSGSPTLVALNNAEPWQLIFYPNLGGGAWGPVLSGIADYGPSTLALGDLNSDGYDDVVASSTANTVAVNLSDGEGGLRLNQPNGNTSELRGNANGRAAAGDLDHDGLLDVVELGQTFLAVKHGLPGAGFTALQTVATFGNDAGTHSVLLADVNRDGWLDVVATLNAGVVVLLGDRAGNLGAAATYGPTGNTQGALLDYDGDGKIDVLSGNGSALQLLLGDGAGAFVASTAFSTAAAPRAVALGDFDGDGDLDALATLGGSL